MVSTAYEMGWQALDNGSLLNAAEAAFDVLLTTDQNLPSQQNLAGRRLSIIVLPTTSWPQIQRHIPQVLAAVSAVVPGVLQELRFEA